MSNKNNRQVKAGLITLLTAVFMTADILPAGIIDSSEMNIKKTWTQKHILKTKLVPESEPVSIGKTDFSKPALYVIANNDPVVPIRNGERPMKLAETNYKNGIYVHAFSRIQVKLPSPGKTFSAVVGLDKNDDTLRGKGSVVFSVLLKDLPVYKSPVMRVDSEPQEISVNLDGADSFAMSVGEAGDGIGWDQSDWANARVILADGKEIFLSDLPVHDLRPEATSCKPISRTIDLPFAFTYDSNPSDVLLASWPMKTKKEKLSRKRVQHTTTWQDPNSPLEVRCVTVEYSDYPAVEWTLYFKNNGNEKTAVIENIQSMDTVLGSESVGDITLHTTLGDTCSPRLYEPVTEKLGPNMSKRYVPNGGRATDGAFPYYRIETADHTYLMAIGWPGRWAASFTRGSDNGVRVIAGQEFTRLYINPNEEIRSPLTAIIFLDGTDGTRAQNVWRRWMIDHNLPRTSDGKLPPPFLFGCTSGIYNEMLGANEENQKYFIDRYIAEKICINYWWMDAGWYPCNGWPQVGTWDPDPKRFPNGLRAISDHARNKGIKTLVWFEPERVAGGTWLSDNHPEWIKDSLLNLGNPLAKEWLINKISNTITEQGIDLYRQDFNMDPLGSWRGSDEPNRQGVTENLHVQGYLAYWDALRCQHPSLIIDSCASGGRRNDLETMRRSVPLHPTDYNYSDLTSKQAFHQSAMQWIPFLGSNAAGCDGKHTYAFRSGISISFNIGYDMRREEDNFDLVRKMTAEWKQIAPYFYGDFYPLTPYTVDQKDWIAWQFNLVDDKEGVVQAFRRPENESITKDLILQGLDPKTTYEVTNLDIGQTDKVSGKDLMERGLKIEIKTKPGAVIIVYKKVK